MLPMKRQLSLAADGPLPSLGRVREGSKPAGGEALAPQFLLPPSAFQIQAGCPRVRDNRPGNSSAGLFTRVVKLSAPASKSQTQDLIISGIPG